MICDEIINIDAYVAPADAGINTTIRSTVAGNYLLRLEFNGTYLQLFVTCEADQVIIIPNIINGEYDHLMQVYLPDGTLFNDTCYCLRTHTINSGTSVNPNPTIFTDSCYINIVVRDNPDADRLFHLCNGDTIPLEYPVGNIVTIEHLAGLYVKRPFFKNNQLEQTPNWNDNTGTWDNTANGGFFDGDLITIEYAQPLS